MFMFLFISATTSRISTSPVDPCSPSPCGSNARCLQRARAAGCMCIEGYFGDPYVGCRPECSTHADCPTNKACQERSDLENKVLLAKRKRSVF